MKERNIEVTWYDDPAEAERDLIRQHRAMTPDERVQLTVEMMMTFGGWKKNGRLARVVQIIDVP